MHAAQMRAFINSRLAEHVKTQASRECQFTIEEFVVWQNANFTDKIEEISTDALKVVREYFKDYSIAGTDGDELWEASSDDAISISW